MRYIKFSGGTGFCGCDFEEYMEFDSITDEQLNEYTDELIYDNANSYADIEIDYDICEDNYDSEEEYRAAFFEAEEAYYNEAYGTWEEISKEEYEENV